MEVHITIQSIIYLAHFERLFYVVTFETYIVNMNMINRVSRNSLSNTDPSSERASH